MKHRTLLLAAALGVVAVPFSSLPLRAEPAASVKVESSAAVDKAQAAIDKAVTWLNGQQQADGSWGKKSDPPAISALVLRTLLGNPKANGQTPEMKKGFAKLLSYQLDNGGIFKDLQGTYNTAIAITALAAA